MSFFNTRAGTIVMWTGLTILGVYLTYVYFKADYVG